MYAGLKWQKPSRAQALGILQACVIQVAIHCAPCIYACMCVCVCVCVCVLDTCELISNDYADYGLADYGLHGFENLSRTKHFFLQEHSAQCIYTGHMRTNQ